MKSKNTLPTWSYPFVLALLGIILAVGHLPSFLQIAVSAETLLFIAYLVIRSHRNSTADSAMENRAVSSLLPLFPGHLLLLFALSIVPGQNTGLVGAWMIIPAASVLYDLVSLRRGQSELRRVSILAGLYCIIWLDVFALLERVVVLGRGIHGASEIKVIVVFGVLAVAFLAAGVYRHLYAIKSSKE